MIVFSAMRIPEKAADTAEALSDILRERTAGSFPRRGGRSYEAGLAATCRNAGGAS